MMVNGEHQMVIHLVTQAHLCAIQVFNPLELDKQLIQTLGNHAGKLAFPSRQGVMLESVDQMACQQQLRGRAAPTS